MIADTVELLSGRWWAFLLRGLVALALAVFAFAAPGSLANVLVYVVAAYFIISGLFALVSGVSSTGVGSWWLLILLGLGQGALGIIMLTRPNAGPLALAYLVAIWAFSTGLMEISGAIALRDYIKNEFWWVLLGIVTLGLGIYIIFRPELGVLALVFSIGIYAAIAGISLIAFSFRLKGAGDEVRKAVSTAQSAGASSR
ncbi:MAG: DUF308 domain-containing protein [Candidatus Eremiobacteraeota bacterium]|nr:DUF308 domain-containing protein [Candidatus Eremiobacteraeota bacterium]